MTKKLLWKSAIIRFFRVKVVQIVCKQPIKGNLHILVILNYTLGYLKFCNIFCIFEIAWARAFKIVYFILLWTVLFFCKLFTFVTFGHQTYDF